MGVNNASLLEDIRATKRNLNISSEAMNQAHTSFNSNYASFLSLAEQLEGKYKELETREAAIEIRENEVRHKNQQLQERENKCMEKERRLEEREKDVTAKEVKWNETEKKMKVHASKLPSVIRFNICGTQFAATKETLLKQKGSLFEQMILSESQPLTSAGEFFIERNPQYFCHVLSVMLQGEIPPPTDMTKRIAIEKEFEFFQIPYRFPAPSFSELTDDKLSEIIYLWLPSKRFQRLYKASVDGFAAADFHKTCDNKGPTLTLILSSNGYLFGGYTPLDWDCTQAYKESNEGFIFTLTNPHNIPPTKYPIKDSRYAIQAHDRYGPLFGGGWDIGIFKNSHQNNNSHTNFPHSYNDTTGKGNITFTGAYNFTATEIEVFSVL